MKILIVGGGGREHALAWKLARDRRHPVLFCAPGNAGTAELGINVPIPAEDIDGVVAWARREKPDLTIIGPEAPLCAGLADRLQAEGFRAFGPCRAAAQLEGSKVFAKSVLQAAGIPTAQSETFTNAEKALAYVRAAKAPLVVKADGLAAGKGVLICANAREAEDAVATAMIHQSFGKAGRQILVEEFLEGEEVSMLALVDGRQAVLLPSAQDHKRALDGDQGLNTGGMGAYSPAPMETADFRKIVLDTIFNPTLKELRRRGITYQGVLYAGLMMTAAGPKVLEFNCRFGDPETQAILPRLKGDLIPAMEACINGNLLPEHAACRPEACVCVVMTAGGYPGAYRKGDTIAGLKEAAALSETMVFHAGTKLEGGQIVTSGGRVLGVTALGRTLAETAEKAYQVVARITFQDAHYRRDIAAKGISRTKT
ncbi:MAG: phosphoribosylamine--glycine ligase [Verrucomicrobia bacterium]|nr:phosphoribosylamine--glycine ligase [Verrucomicrobiota bacterium]MBU1855417.1 phosphoribosylamine--glycine ligase [Verrucomicrobiota bacterium]